LRPEFALRGAQDSFGAAQSLHGFLVERDDLPDLLLRLPAQPGAIEDILDRAQDSLLVGSVSFRPKSSSGHYQWSCLHRSRPYILYQTENSGRVLTDPGTDRILRSFMVEGKKTQHTTGAAVDEDGMARAL
jgi:hypothetical protein